MKYMTPDLYARINLASDAEVEALYDEWEANGLGGRARLAAIETQLPASLRDFLKSICLHDAELRGFETDPASDSALGVAVMNLRLGNRIITLYYDLLEPLERRPVEIGLSPEQHRAVWTTGTPEWLYDEIDVIGDVADPAGFVHEILLSTGEIILLVFFGFDWHVHQVGTGISAGAPRS